MDSFMLEIWLYAQVVLGIGLVIFVHESGHFLAARACRVRVDVFSLGFGPKLFGWRRGATLYQVALVPLGGYVKMAGEESADSGARPAPDELGSKSVGQRFFIYSGGVLANVLFGLVVFPIVFAVGVPFGEPVLGRSQPGSPAWHAGLQAGTRVLSVNGNEVFGFINIPNEVALGSQAQTELEVLEPGAREPRTVRLTPVYSDKMGANHIGVEPAFDAQGTISVEEDSPAARAGLATGDHLLGLKDALPGQALEDQLQMVMLAGRGFTARVERDGRSFDATVEPQPSLRPDAKVLGVLPLHNRVVDVKHVPLGRELGLQAGDRILSVNGMPLLWEYDLLRALHASQGPIVLEVLREGTALELAGPALDGPERLAVADVIALDYDQDSTRVVVTPGSAAADAGLQSGDRILSIDGAQMQSYKDVQELAKKAAKDRALQLSVERRASWSATASVEASAPQFVQLDVTPKPAPSYGLGLQSAQYVYRATSPLQALKVGVQSSWRFIEESFRTLARIVQGKVSGSNIGGIITIGVVSHSWASVGIAKLVFFLCMLSMNLAFLNVLPIPVLDGGHLFFLLIEKIKGSPVSERVLGYSQMVGMVLILSLMVYVTFNDVVRWFVH